MESSSTGAVRKQLRGGVLTLTLDRPGRHNAIDAEMRDALAEALDEAVRAPEARAVVLTGAGGAFCAGIDLGRFESAELRDPRLYHHSSHAVSDLLNAVERLEKPTIAAIDGVATGAGLTLALCCDWRTASARARLLYREGRLNLVATHGGVARLVKLVGLARAKQAMLGGDDLDASAAFRLGLVTELVPGDPVAAAQHRATTMLDRAPLSYAAAKRLLRLAADSDAGSTALAESLAQAALLATDDHREGLAAARERREPLFAGR